MLLKNVYFNFCRETKRKFQYSLRMKSFYCDKKFILYIASRMHEKKWTNKEFDVYLDYENI